MFCVCRTYDEEPEESIKQCQVLLEEPELETAVRIGDVYGIMIEHFASQQNYAKVSHTFILSVRGFCVSYVCHCMATL